jgi:hypothetical protein
MLIAADNAIQNATTTAHRSVHQTSFFWALEAERMRVRMVGVSLRRPFGFLHLAKHESQSSLLG